MDSKYVQNSKKSQKETTNPKTFFIRRMFGGSPDSTGFLDIQWATMVSQKMTNKTLVYVVILDMQWTTLVTQTIKEFPKFQPT